MKITVYSLATDDDEGTTARVFGSEEERDDALLSWVGSNRESWAQREHPVDLHEYVQTLSDHLDTFSTDQQEVEIDLHDILSVNAAWRFCKEPDGAFGNLYDPEEVATIMDGWAEEGDRSDGSNWFQTDSAEEMAAITAWCEKNGPGFEQQISNLVCENLPTRKEAFDTLAEKRRVPNGPIIA